MLRNTLPIRLRQCERAGLRAAEMPVYPSAARLCRRVSILSALSRSSDWFGRPIDRLRHCSADDPLRHPHAAKRQHPMLAPSLKQQSETSKHHFFPAEIAR